LKRQSGKWITDLRGGRRFIVQPTLDRGRLKARQGKCLSPRYPASEVVMCRKTGGGGIALHSLNSLSQSTPWHGPLGDTHWGNTSTLCCRSLCCRTYKAMHCWTRGDATTFCVYTLCLALPLAVFDPKVGQTMNRRPPCRSVVYFPDCLFKFQPRP